MGPTDPVSVLTAGGGAADPLPAWTTGGGGSRFGDGDDDLTPATVCGGDMTLRQRARVQYKRFSHAVAPAACEKRDFRRPSRPCGWRNRMPRSFSPACKKGFH
uniref:Uncharacterized protein n=1 Tax=Oryza glumipatula TaxID=40148 RepID=A0A0D9ZWI3_9ORYZ